MQVLSARFLAGPNVHHRESMLVAVCDLADAPEVLDLIANPPPGGGFAPVGRNPLPESLHGLASEWRAAAGAGKPVLEQLLHVALALQREVIASPDLFGSVLGMSGTRVSVALRCDSGETGLAAWELAVASAPVILALASDPAARRPAADALATRLAAYREYARLNGLDQLTLALVRQGMQRDIPWMRLGFPARFVQLGQARHRRRLHETLLQTTGAFAERLSRNKSATNQLLARLGFPVPRQFLVETVDAAVEAAARIGYPVVAKPCHGGKGRGVAVGLATAEQVRRAFPAAAEGGDAVVIESMVAGNDHRLLVVGGRLVAAALRTPGKVIGDGRSSVAELVDRLNRDPQRGSSYTTLLERIDIDREALDLLARQQLSPGSVPRAGVTVWLRSAANIHRGGTAQDVTDAMHPDNVLLAQEAAVALDLDVAGVDFLTPDISRSWRELPGAIIEINANPGLRPHWLGNAATGRQRDVVGPILELLFPPGAPARVPTAAVTGSVGKTTTCQMIAAMLAAAGMRVGLTTTQGMYVGGRRIVPGDHAGGRAACNLLLRSDVDAGVFEMARGGLVKAGMALDRCDVGVVLNVQDNHVGLDDVPTREAMARVKRIVAENATGLAVLNADDPLCLAMRAHVRSRALCLVSARPGHPEVAAHRAAGGITVAIEGAGAAARIVVAEGGREWGVLPVAAIPATLEGRAMGKVVNAAFALAAAHGMGIGFDAAARGLAGFASNFETNPGRQNFFEGLPYKVLLDWADGPVATGELAALAAQVPVQGRRLALLSAVGNRPDEFIVAAGRAAAGAFDAYLCTNFTDLRGRVSADDVPELLKRGLVAGGVAAERIRCVPDHLQAIDQVLALAAPGDLVAMASYATEEAWNRIRAAGQNAAPVL